MRSMNKVTIIGNLGVDPEMRFTADGKAVTSFRVATNRRVGEREETEWFNIVTWGKLADTCNKFLTKGRQVYIEGRLQTRSWEGQDGQTRYKTEVMANDVLFLDRKSNEIDKNNDEDDIVDLDSVAGVP